MLGFAGPRNHRQTSPAQHCSETGGLMRACGNNFIIYCLYSLPYYHQECRVATVTKRKLAATPADGPNEPVTHETTRGHCWP